MDFGRLLRMANLLSSDEGVKWLTSSPLFTASSIISSGTTDGVCGARKNSSGSPLVIAGKNETDFWTTRWISKSSGPYKCI